MVVSAGEVVGCVLRTNSISPDPFIITDNSDSIAILIVIGGAWNAPYELPGSIRLPGLMLKKAKRLHEAQNQKKEGRKHKWYIKYSG